MRNSGAVPASMTPVSRSTSPSRNGALFPHLYRALRLDEVIWAKPLPLVDGAHRFPEGMT